MSQIKKEAVRVIAAALPAQEIAGLEATFKAIDTDSNGILTKEELVTALKTKASLLKNEDWECLMKAVETTSSVDYSSFLASVMGANQLLKEENLLRAFQHFDTDSSGTITRDELKAAFKSHGARGASVDAEVDAVLAEVDTDGNGKIDYQEFCGFMLLKKA